MWLTLSSPGILTSALRVNWILLSQGFDWSCLMNTCWPKSAAEIQWPPFQMWVKLARGSHKEPLTYSPSKSLAWKKAIIFIYIIKLSPVRWCEWTKPVQYQHSLDVDSGMSHDHNTPQNAAGGQCTICDHVGETARPFIHTNLRTQHNHNLTSFFEGMLYACVHVSISFRIGLLSLGVISASLEILLMEEILHHLGWLKPYK